MEKAGAAELDGRCPVCEAEAPDLLQKLRSRAEESLSTQIASIQEEIKSLEGRETGLQKIADQYAEANRKQGNLLNDLADRRREAGKLLEKELTDQDDPAALLNVEAKRIGDRLDELVKAIQQKQERLDDVSKRLDAVHVIVEILQTERKMEIAQQIQQTPEYQELEEARDAAAAFLGDVEAVKEAVSKIANEEAHDKLAAAESAIEAFFRQLTKHPAVQRIKLHHKSDPSGRNSYNVTDQSDSDLFPFLSQGDLNALALAIFLGLVSSSAPADGFGFVMLDDPSQSLDRPHKEQLVDVLDRVAQSKRVVLATMDSELRELLRTRLTRDKVEYLFEEWTTQQGAQAKPG